MNISAMLNQWGEIGIGYAVHGLLEATVGFALVSGLWFLLRKRAGAPLGYLLYLLVLIKVLVPWQITVPWEMRYASPERAIAEAVQWTAVQVHPAAEPFAESVTFPPSRPANPLPVLTNLPTTEPSSSISAPVSVSTPAVPLSGKAKVLFAWMALSLVLLGRFLWMQWKTAKILRQSEPVDPVSWPVNWEALNEQAGIRRPISLRQNPCITTPLVWGLFRPEVIVPSGITTLLSPAQIRWMLLHELGHIRRLDMPVTLFQRVMQIVFFWNPAIWMANGMIYQLREYACDDFALSICGESRREYGEGLLHVVERAVSMPEPVSQALGLLDTKTFLMKRLRRIVDPRRRVCRSLSVKAALGLALAAALILPVVRAETDGMVQLQGTVIDQVSREPVSGAAIRLVQDKKDLVHFGPARHITVAETHCDEKGSYVFRNVAPGTYLIQAEAEDYVPFMMNGFNPGEFVILDAAHEGQMLTIEMAPGGAARIRVVDDQQKPVAGARVYPMVSDPFPDAAPKDTDEQGICLFTNLKTKNATVLVRHPQYGEEFASLFQPGPLNNPADVTVTLHPAGSITGQVVMRDGSIGKGISLYLTHTIQNSQIGGYGKNGEQSVKTDDNGRFSFTGLGQGHYWIWANDNETSQGKWYDAESVELDLKSGEHHEIAKYELAEIPAQGVVKGKVVSESGEPITYAEIYGHVDGDYHIEGINSYPAGLTNGHAITDENGEFSIQNIIAAESFNYRISAFGYLGQEGKCPTNGEALTIALKKAGSLSGRVVDAESGQPVAYAVLHAEGNEQHAPLSTIGRAFTTSGRDGSFRLESLNAGMIRLVAEAPGYVKGTLEGVEIMPGQEVKDVVITLQKGREITGTVLGPDNQPLPGAKVGLLSKIKTQTNIIGFHEPAELMEAAVTGDDGRFRLAGAAAKGDEVIVFHPEYASARRKITPEALSDPISVHLTPGGSVEGVVADEAGTLLKGARIQIFNFPENIFTYETTTDEKGYFRVDLLPATELYVRKSYMTREDANNHEQRIVAVEEGKTVSANFGAGSGCIITGTIYDEGKPLARAQLALQKNYEDSMREDQIVTKADDAGRYTFKGVPAGEWIIAFSKPPRDLYTGNYPDGFQPVTIPVDQGELQLELYTKAYQLTLLIRDKNSNKPLEGVRITPFASDKISLPPQPLLLRGGTREDGKALFTPKVPMKYELLLMKPGYATTTASVEVPPVPVGQTTSAVTQEIAMAPSATTIDLYLANQGTAWNGEDVHCTAVKDGVQYPLSTEKMSDQPGTYRITGAPAGMVELKVSADDEKKGYFTLLPAFLLKANQTHTVMTELMEVLSYQIWFKKTVAGEAKIEIPDYPAFTTTQNVRPNGLLLTVPAGNHSVRITVPGYKPIEIVPEKMATPEAYSHPALIEVNMEEE